VRTPIPALTVCLGLALSLPACKEDPTPTAESARAADAAAKPKPPPPAAIRPGEGLGPLRLGQPPPADHDGQRQAGDGRVLYWSELGLEAVLDAQGRVREAVAHGEGGDPFFRTAFEGQTAGKLGLGAPRAGVIAAHGPPAKETPLTSPFVSGLVRLDYPGIGFEVGGPDGKVTAIRVTPPAAAPPPGG